VRIEVSKEMKEEMLFTMRIRREEDKRACSSQPVQSQREVQRKKKKEEGKVPLDTGISGIRDPVF
jgi:hypothetical protein